jgi:hypothetical protein
MKKIAQLSLAVVVVVFFFFFSRSSWSYVHVTVCDPAVKTPWLAAFGFHKIKEENVRQKRERERGEEGNNGCSFVACSRPPRRANGDLDVVKKRINLPCGHGRPSVHPDVGHAVQHHGARTTYYLQRRRLHRRRSATAATVLMLMVSSLSVEKMA